METGIQANHDFPFKAFSKVLLRFPFVVLTNLEITLSFSTASSLVDV